MMQHSRRLCNLSIDENGWLNYLSDIVDMIIEGGQTNEIKLKGHLPPTRLPEKLNGMDDTELGVKPIVYMREFMQNLVLSDELVEKIHAGSSQ